LIAPIALQLTGLDPALAEVLEGSPESPLYLPAAFLATSWNDPSGIKAVRNVFASEQTSHADRIAALNALVAAGDQGILDVIDRVLAAVEQQKDNAAASTFAAQILAALGRMEQPQVSQVVLSHYASLDSDLQVRSIELLTQRASWAKSLLAAIGTEKIPASAINANQARRLYESGDKDLAELLARHWGTIRTERDPARLELIATMKRQIRQNPGDPVAGIAVFNKVCGQCHKMYGTGAEVGPDITLNGRSSFDQLLSNVFDPSLVIGASYQARIIITNGGRVLTGLPVEDSEQRVVLKVQGGKLETIPRGDIDEMKVSELSMMPEGLEKQLQPQELADLFAYITLDRPPTDPEARQLPGVRAPAPRATTNPNEFGALVNDVLPGFSTRESGEGGVAILADHQGREGVLRTHPVSRDKPCFLTQTLTLPEGKRTWLVLDVSHDARGDWRLVVRGNGQRMADEMISRDTCPNGWRTLRVDLSKFAGQQVKIDLTNQANDWAWEYAYWGGAHLVHE